MSELTEKNLIESLKDYLIEHGYPERSIILEYPLGKYRADLVVVDLETNVPMQLFELKTTKNQRTIDVGKHQLEKFLSEARKINADIISYLVFPSSKQPYFEAINFDALEKNTNINFDYNNQINRSRSLNLEIIKTRKAEVVDVLKVKITRLLIFIAIFFVLDIFHVIEITMIRFYMLIMMSVLYILPNYEEIKIFNLELKKHGTKNDANKE